LKLRHIHAKIRQTHITWSHHYVSHDMMAHTIAHIHVTSVSSTFFPLFLVLRDPTKHAGSTAALSDVTAAPHPATHGSERERLSDNTIVQTYLLWLHSRRHPSSKYWSCCCCDWRFCLYSKQIGDSLHALTRTKSSSSHFACFCFNQQGGAERREPSAPEQPGRRYWKCQRLTKKHQLPAPLQFLPSIPCPDVHTRDHDRAGEKMWEGEAGCEWIACCMWVNGWLHVSELLVACLQALLMQRGVGSLNSMGSFEEQPLFVQFFCKRDLMFEGSY